MTIRRREERPGYQPAANPDVTAGFRAAEASLAQGIRVMDRVTDIATHEAAKQAEVAGTQAGMHDSVQYDEKGNLKPLTILPQSWTIYGDAYRKAALTNYALAARTQGDLKAEEFGRSFPNDPEMARTKWNEYQTETLKGLHPDVAPYLEPMLNRTGGEMFSRLADQKALNERTTALQGLGHALEQLTNSELNKVSMLGFTPGAIERSAVTFQKEALPLINQIKALNPTFDDKKILQAYTAEMITRQVANDAVKQLGYVTNPATGQIVPDYTAVQKHLEAMKADPELQKYLSPEELDGMVRYGVQQAQMKAAQTETSRNMAEANRQIGVAKTFADFQIRIASDATDSTQLMNDIRAAYARGELGVSPLDNEMKYGQLVATAINREQQIANRAASANKMALEIQSKIQSGDMFTQGANDSEAFWSMAGNGQALDFNDEADRQTIAQGFAATGTLPGNVIGQMRQAFATGGEGVEGTASFLNAARANQATRRAYDNLPPDIRTAMEDWNAAGNLTADAEGTAAQVKEYQKIQQNRMDPLKQEQMKTAIAGMTSPDAVAAAADASVNDALNMTGFWNRQLTKAFANSGILSNIGGALGMDVNRGIPKGMESVRDGLVPVSERDAMFGGDPINKPTFSNDALSNYSELLKAELMITPNDKIGAQNRAMQRLFSDRHYGISMYAGTQPMVVKDPIENFVGKDSELYQQAVEMINFSRAEAGLEPIPASKLVIGSTLKITHPLYNGSKSLAGWQISYTIPAGMEGAGMEAQLPQSFVPLPKSWSTFAAENAGAEIATKLPDWLQMAKPVTAWTSKKAIEGYDATKAFLDVGDVRQTDGYKLWREMQRKANGEWVDYLPENSVQVPPEGDALTPGDMVEPEAPPEIPFVPAPPIPGEEEAPGDQSDAGDLIPSPEGYGFEKPKKNGKPDSVGDGGNAPIRKDVVLAGIKKATKNELAALVKANDPEVRAAAQAELDKRG